MDGVSSSRDVATELRKMVGMRFDQPKAVWGIPWSGPFGDFPTLDYLTGGIEKYMHVLVSRPGYGKSGLAGQIAGNVGEWTYENASDRTVVVFSSEMAPSAYQRRMACQLSGVDNNAVKTGFMSYKDAHEREIAYEQFLNAVSFIEKLPIIFKSGRVSVNDIVRLVIGEGTKEEPQAVFWVLDHIGLVTDAFDNYNRRALDQVSSRLQNLSQNCVGGLILGHVNRGNEMKVDKEPTLETVAGSDQICRDADWLFALHRPDKAGAKQPDEVAAKPIVPGKLKILKARDGSDDEIWLNYHKARTYWAESRSLNKR